MFTTFVVFYCVVNWNANNNNQYPEAVKMTIEKYTHHGKEVYVDSELKGKHREHCLCYKCKNLFLDDQEKNCKIANVLYRLCILLGIVIPVYECPDFKITTEKDFESDIGPIESDTLG